MQPPLRDGTGMCLRAAGYPPLRASKSQVESVRTHSYTVADSPGNQTERRTRAASVLSRMKRSPFRDSDGLRMAMRGVTVPAARCRASYRISAGMYRRAAAAQENYKKRMQRGADRTKAGSATKLQQAVRTGRSELEAGLSRGPGSGRIS